MMKQKSRLAAFLLALCLLASLAVMPAAAAGESLETLRQELDAAKKELEDAKSAFTAADNALDAAQKKIDAATNAQSKLAEVEEAYKKAEAELKAAENSPEDETVDLPALKKAVEEAKKAWDDAQSAYNTAKNEADTVRGTIDGLEQKKSDADAAVKAAEAEVESKKKALEDAEKDQTVPEPPSTPGSGDVAVSSSTVDFGKLGKGATSDLTRTFTITNRSQYNMSLSTSPVSGYTVSGADGTLSAGGSATVTVRLDSTSSTGTYNRMLTVYASFAGGSGSYPLSISLYAEVVEAGYSLTVSPSSKDFGKLPEGYEEKAAKDLGITVAIENKGASSVQMNGVKGSDHFVVSAVRTEYETLKNGEKAEYKVVPKHGLAIGTYTDTITFQTREGATVSFKATVAVEKKLDPLSVEPAALNFGMVEEGYAALDYQKVTVKNNTDRALLLTQPSSYSYEISALPQTTLAAGGSITLNIRPRTGLPANQYGGTIEINGGGEQARLNVQFTVTRPAGPTSFSDVAADSTFAADIAYVSQKGLMSGVGNGNFNPKAPITRGQLVTILYRLEGQPAVSGLGFTDVAAGSYCEKAVKWAAATGITNGGADGLFKPNDPISREQMATFLYRYNQHKGYFAMKLADLSTFPDVSSIASYAKDAMSWANGSGLINGTGDGRLNPSGGANRGQAAAILHRYCVSIGQ